MLNVFFLAHNTRARHIEPLKNIEWLRVQPRHLPLHNIIVQTRVRRKKALAQRAAKISATDTKALQRVDNDIMCHICNLILFTFELHPEGK